MDLDSHASGFVMLLGIAFVATLVVPPSIKRSILRWKLKTTPTGGRLFLVSALEISACFLSFCLTGLLSGAQFLHSLLPDHAFVALWLFMWWLENVGLNLFFLVRSPRAGASPMDPTEKRLLISSVLGLVPLVPLLGCILFVAILAT
jgi:hypothetical protein